MKVMAAGLEGGTSFMEDYTYHFGSTGSNGTRMKILGSHMLEVCETIASPSEKPRLEVHPLSIGGKADPGRLAFDVLAVAATAASVAVVDNRLRLVVHYIDPLP